MSAEERLPANLPPQPVDDLRQVPNHSRMKGELRLFEQEGARSVQKHPEKPKEPQRPIRKLLLGLPACVRTPMLVEPLQMRDSRGLVAEDVEDLQLRYRDAQRFLDPAQPGVACFFGVLKSCSRKSPPNGSRERPTDRSGSRMSCGTMCR